MTRDAANQVLSVGDVCLFPLGVGQSVPVTIQRINTVVTDPNAPQTITVTFGLDLGIQPDGRVPTLVKIASGQPALAK